MTLSEHLTILENKVARIRNEKRMAKVAYTENCIAYDTQKQEIKDTEDAQVFLQAVAKQVQQRLEYHVSEIATLALESVFPDPYIVKLTFESKRGKTDAQFSFIRDGEEVDPLTGAGGGTVDVAAFALRLALWSLKSPRTRPTIILDEPFKWPSKSVRSNVAKLLKDLSKKLGIQIIMVTHDTDLIEHADKVFSVSMQKGVSSVTVLSDASHLEK